MAQLTLNPDHLGEFAKFYYMYGAQDLSTAGQMPIAAEDATLWALAWLDDLCPVSVDAASSINNYEVQDRCVGNVVGNTPGREGFTVDVVFNQMRLGDSATPYDLLTWQQAMDQRQIVAIMCLTADKSDDDAWGFVMNAVRIDENETQPESGLMQTTYTFGPAARASTIGANAIKHIKRRTFGATWYPGP